MTTCPQCSGPQRDGVVRVRRSMVIALYAIGLLLAYTLGGQLLHDLAEGMDRHHLALWKLFVPSAVLLLAVAASFLRLRRAVCERCPPRGLFAPLAQVKAERILSSDGAGRRTALRTLGAGGATVAAAATGVGAAVLANRRWIPVARDFFAAEVEYTAAQPRPEWKDATIKSYRRLGRTNVEVSDIALGAGRIGAEGSDPVGFKQAVEVARAAIDSGQFLVAGLFLVMLFVVFVGMSATVLPVVQGEPPRGLPPNEYRDSFLMVGPAIACLALVLLLGIYIPPPVNGLLQNAANFLEGRP